MVENTSIMDANIFQWVNASKGVKDLSQQVFQRAKEELEFMNLQYKLGFYFQKAADTTGSYFVMAGRQPGV